jgi:lipopolysaccharide transport system ATP-binding protein
MAPAVSVENVSKLYRLGERQQPGYRTLREAISSSISRSWRRARQAGNTDGSGDEHWALKDVSFEIRTGEVVGIIGRNGAGKSTLLKILSRITDPHSGRIVVYGRVGSLLEVGVGFHHELTGRENIYLNGAIFGMSRKEIARKFDEIVEFAEVGPFLDTPVKRYSSGMYVRLAFAVASHMEPEILLVDEVLAVGDSAFQKKCLGKMDQVSRTGRTVVFVSHNMATILNLCDKAIVLERGRLKFDGNCQEGVALYTSTDCSLDGGDLDLSEHPNRRPGSPPILGRIRVLNSRGEPTDRLLCGEAVSIELELDARCRVPAPQFAIGVDDNLGCRLLTAATYLSDSPPPRFGRTRRLVCHINELALLPGRYCLTLNAGPVENPWTDMIDQAVWFNVEAADFYGNGRLPNPDWGRFLVRSTWDKVE